MMKRKQNNHDATASNHSLRDNNNSISDIASNNNRNHHSAISNKRTKKDFCLYSFLPTFLFLLFFVILFFRYEFVSLQQKSSLHVVSSHTSKDRMTQEEEMISNDDRRVITDLYESNKSDKEPSHKSDDTSAATHGAIDGTTDKGDKNLTTILCSKNQQCAIRFKKGKMALCYFLPYGKNFGDELGPAMSEQLVMNHFAPCSHKNFTIFNLASSSQMQARNVYNYTCLFTLGSIMHFVKSYDHIWGTGINPFRLNKRSDGMLARHIIIHSTRGPQTWRIFQNQSYQYYNHSSMTSQQQPPMGDPGFLTPTLYPQYQRQIPNNSNNNDAIAKLRYCVIPHVQDLNLPEIQEIRNIKDDNIMVHIISPHNHWELVVKQMTSCDYVASSSLHGLIVADAMSIPTLWFQLENTLTSTTEGLFKYIDYYESIQQYDKKPLTKDLRQHIFQTTFYQLPPPINIQKQYISTMIHSFPYHLFERTCQ